MSFPIPQQLAKHADLIKLAAVFDLITPISHPDLTARVTAKEAMIARMSVLIDDSSVPLLLAFLAPDHGLKAAFVRQIGENGETIFLGAIEKIAAETQPVVPDINLKWQIVRAYRALSDRFPGSTDVMNSANSVLSFLNAGADAPLQAGILGMKQKLGI